MYFSFISNYFFNFFSKNFYSSYFLIKINRKQIKTFKEDSSLDTEMVLSEKGLGDAIQEYIEKDEKDSIAELINFQIEKLQVSLCSIIL